MDQTYIAPKESNLVRHIYIFGSPESRKTVMMIEANAKKYGTLEDSEWLLPLHGLFDEMKNPS